jgi:uncharacterized membrane protein
MIPHVSLTGGIHAVLALLCIVIGAVQLVRPKRGAGHRARGYAYVYAMLVVDGLALLVHQATGTFNVLHVGAIANLICLVMAIVPILCNPRPRIWKYLHYYWIAWSYVGLMSAGVTQLVIRLGPPMTSGQTWAATFAVTVTVSVIGYIVIEKNRPAPGQDPAVAGTIQQDGALS